MALTVSDTLELENLKCFRLVAGAGGLKKPVVRTGIVDFEFVPEISLRRPAVFDEHSFVISSLLFAREDEQILCDAVRSLIDMGVSALGYKNIFFEQLPETVIELANRNDFAIFEFDDSAYFEDIIADLSLAIREDSQLTVMELKLRELIKQEHSRDEIASVTERLFGGFKAYLSAFCCLPKPGVPRLQIDRVAKSYSINGKRQQESAIGRYGNAMIVLVSSEDGNLEKHIRLYRDVMASCGLSPEDYRCGYSTTGKTADQLDYKLREAVFARDGTALLARDFLCYQDMGTYRFLMPYQDMMYLKDYCRDYLSPLLKLPNDQKRELLKTAIAFVECGGQLKETAARLFVHENTARYRMNKLREKLEPEGTEYEFFANLSCAVRLYLLRKQ